MKMKTKISFGIAALAAAGTIGFVPANAHKDDVASSSSFATVMAAVNSPETPQDQVWDMTYGFERPSFVEDSVAIEDSIVDYTFG